MPRATTVRFTDEMFARLDQASARTGMPVNSIVIAACLEWMQRYTSSPSLVGAGGPYTLSPDVLVEGSVMRQFPAAPRWATLRRAVGLAGGSRATTGMYPFQSFTGKAQNLLTLAQTEALKAGFSYIGTEHMLLAAFGDPDFQSAKILAAVGVAEEAVRSAIERHLGKKKRAVPTRIIPTSRVKRVIELAFNLCDAAGDLKVGTGHLLLALAAEEEGIAGHVLRDLGATRARIESAMGGLTEPEA